MTDLEENGGRFIERDALEMTLEHYKLKSLAHIGVIRKSGRYPWGSGDNPHQRNKTLLVQIDELKAKGLGDTEIAKGLGMTTTQYRALRSIAKNEQRKALQARATYLKEQQGMSNVAIGRELGVGESRVRALLDPAAQDRAAVLQATTTMLRDSVAERGMIDVGLGIESQLGISKEKLASAVAELEVEGYRVHKIDVDQVFGEGKTNVKVLTPPGTEYGDVWKNKGDIQLPNSFSDDGMRTVRKIEPPVNLSSKRVEVRYGPEGGAEMDGVIQIRRGVDDISLGGKKYAQVRIAVDGSHYLKGMAMYTDDLPDGVDVRFNTNKDRKPDKLAAMKGLNDDAEAPFGAIVKQRYYIDKSGKERQSVMNIVNEEGDWNDWSRNLASQMLSKQSPKLAKDQLDLKFQSKKAEYDEIMALQNPAVKRKLLEAFADDMDSSSVHLKAAALPRQKTQVILPINSLKDTEVYAPQFRDGEQVALVRFPHGGTFEIPILTVNNRNREGGRVIKQAEDAIGINAKVAGRLSGADFDGDSVLVIPNNKGLVKNSSPLTGLKDFEPQVAYKPYDGMRTMDGATWDAKAGKKVFPEGKKPSTTVKGTAMGDVSNLITDMTIKGATHAELARAVRHSMVVIDAEKHSLNYKQSAVDNGIKELKQKYQAEENSRGAATIISRSKGRVEVAQRKPRPMSQGGPIDKVTGEKVYVNTDNSWVNAQGETITPVTRTNRMSETRDARTLVSSAGKPIEYVYADHANKLKSLANEARKQSLSITPTPYSKTARAEYAPQVASLKAKLNEALKNKPRERQAQLIADTVIRQKRQDSPGMESADLKRVKSRALETARARTGADKQRVTFDDLEWEAVQKGAISNNFLNELLSNADLDVVKTLATPREPTVLTPTQSSRIKAMYDRGYTQQEIADQLGIATGSVNTAVKGG